jgi:hypothetical protein
MSKINFESVQKILHLDAPYPNFPSWEEKLEFAVDGVTVKAIVKRAWRQITIRIVEPFDVHAWTFEPPLIALGAAIRHRQALLEKRGITDTEDCIVKARNAYLRHVAYLRLKPEIDAAQQEFLKQFSQKLDSLLLVSEAVNARVRMEKTEQRRKFKAGEIGQKEYQLALKNLQQQACDASTPYSNLKYKVDTELKDIQNSMIDEWFAGQVKND